MVLLENDHFIAELNKLFLESRVKGAVRMTIKRYDGRTKPIPKSGKRRTMGSEPTCLLRATTAKKDKKISTIVHQKDVVKFQITYFTMLKNSLDGLKKAKKAKKSKAV